MAWTTITVDGKVRFRCTVTEVVFGPAMESGREAEVFAEWLGGDGDPRGIDAADLLNRYHDFVRHNCYRASERFRLRKEKARLEEDLREIEEELQKLSGNTEESVRERD